MFTAPTFDDTIAAISTPLGAGGIGIVRLSGPDSLAVLRALFRPAAVWPESAPRQLCRGYVVDPNSAQVVDEVLSVYMPAPHTYTRQPVVEIDTHGGGLVLRRVLRLCLEQGARQAEPGEFTLRAFVSGRIDLTQAEAVRDLVSARTELAARQAVAQLQGGLGARVRSCRGQVLAVLAAVEAAIDFEDGFARDETMAALAAAAGDIEALLASAKGGMLRREGLRVAIVGRPNVGKSSLLNALLRFDRAIVSEVPGTTRDTLEEAVDLDGLAVVFVDTAGLRRQASGDPVERLGQERSRKAIDAADLVLLVLDASELLQAADYQVAEMAATAPAMITVWNKTDLVLPRQPSPRPGGLEVMVSALTGAGLQDLRQAVRDLALGNGPGTEEASLNTERQEEAAQDSLRAALSAAEGLARGLPLDMIAEDLRQACRALGQITGESTDADLLAQIFSSFCVGK